MMEQHSAHWEIQQNIRNGYLDVHTNVTQENTRAYVMKYKKLYCNDMCQVKKIHKWLLCLSLKTL